MFALGEIVAGLEFDLLSTPAALPELTPPPRRLWLDDKATRFALVDEEDYEHFSRWRWSAKPDKWRRKFYAVRTVRKRPYGCYCLFLHKAILKRAIGEPPDERHTLGDHWNGDSLDCRRANLRYATPSMNRRNVRA